MACSSELIPFNLEGHLGPFQMPFYVKYIFIYLLIACIYFLPFSLEESLSYLQNN